MDKIKNIAIFTSDILLLLAITMTLPLIITFLKGETNAMIGFIMTIGVCVLLYLIVHIFIKKTNYKFKYRDGFIVTTFIWVIVVIVGSLPYVFSKSIPNFFDAIFESSSGFTTTGASVLSDVESLPRSILFWRSMTNWIGGMGILVLLSAILSSWGVNGQTVAFNESTGPSKGKLTSRFSDTAKILYAFYIALTILCIISLKLCKLSWFDSITHTFATVATGGFSTYNNGIMHFNSPMVELVLVIFMAIAGTNFYILLNARNKNGFKNIFKDEEVKLYIYLILFSTLVIFGYNYILNHEEIKRTLLDALFQTVSIITTTGFASCDFNLWPTFSKFILFLLFFTGACASSTSGGMKCIRVLITFKLIRRGFSLKVHPNRIVRININNKEVSTEQTIRVTTFILTYLTTFTIGTILLSTNGLDFTTNISAAATLLGNVGPGFSAIGPVNNFGCFTDFSKLVSSFLMIFGRLEILPIFVLFSRNYWNPNSIH